MKDSPDSDAGAETLDVTLIVIAYNSEGRITEAIESHEEAIREIRGEILVVDNASQDGSVREARTALRTGRVIANPSNVGYGKAANQGIVEARGRACLIMNDDARISGDALERLLVVLDSDEEIALVGPRIIDEDGNPMPSARLDFPGPAEELSRLRDVLSRRNSNYLYPVDGDDPTDVAWLVGACILGRTETLRRVGGFNPAFFLYVEDIDLCRRFNELGYRIVSVPSAVCVHTGSVSTGTAFSEQARIHRRAEARSLYYGIWYPKPVRSLIHLKRALGIKNQPQRLRYHLPRVFKDGSTVAYLRFPPPLERGSGSV